MAKGKAKDDTPNPNTVPNKDIIQRMNFLYQAAAYMAEVENLPPSAWPSGHSQQAGTSTVHNLVGGAAEEATENEGKSEEGNDAAHEVPQARSQGIFFATDIEERKSHRQEATPFDLAAAYGRSIRDIGLKTNVRM